MRNGVIAIHRDGTLALMNDEAYRIFALTPRADDSAGRSPTCSASGPTIDPRAGRRVRAEPRCRTAPSCG